jgi:STE24 endopeptidase
MQLDDVEATVTVTRGSDSTSTRLWHCSLVLVALMCMPVVAQQVDDTPPAPATQTDDGTRGEGAQTTEYRLTPEQYEKAAAYSRIRIWLQVVGFAYGVAVLLGVLGLGVAGRLRDLAERRARRRFVQALVFVPLLLLLLGIAALPTDVAGQHFARAYDQSVQGWGSWTWDWVKAQLIAIVISVPMIWLLYGVIRRSPRRWWFYFWLVAAPIVFFLIFITPVVIQPLFFNFEPLAARQPALVEDIDRVVRRAGLEIPRDRMFEMDASTKLNAVNAYVTGFGASKRVVFWDTTLQRMTRGESLFVFGHEMGHYVLHHMWYLVGVTLALLLALLYLGYRSMHWTIARFGPAWRVRSVDDWASLPVLLLFFTVYGFVAQPITNTFSRHLEHQADIYGLEVIRDTVPQSPEAAARAFQILGEINLADPNPHPFVKVWFYSHPPLAERVRFAATYDPAADPKYVQ